MQLGLHSEIHSMQQEMDARIVKAADHAPSMKSHSDETSAETWLLHLLEVGKGLDIDARRHACTVEDC